MHRATFIEKLTEVQQTVEQLLAQLQASEHDKFAAHLYQSRREYRSACQRAGKGGSKSSAASSRPFRWAESLGFKGDFRHWGAPLADWRLRIAPRRLSGERGDESRRRALLAAEWQQGPLVT